MLETSNSTTSNESGIGARRRLGIGTEPPTRHAHAEHAPRSRNTDNTSRPKYLRGPNSLSTAAD